MRFATTLLVLAAVIGLAAAPVAFLVFWYSFPTTWLIELPKYQALFGALIALFAASLASVGVAVTIWNQRLIVARQLAAQRQEQDLARGLTRQQIASAFIGEIAVILDELRHEFLRPVLETTVRNMELSEGQEIRVSTVRIGRHLGRYFDSNPGNVGLFPSAISEGLTRFYATLEEIRLDLDWYSSAIESNTKNETPLMSGQQILALIWKILREIDECLQSGPTLIEGLRVIRDAKLD
jgi:hypothetical protein